MTEPTHDLILQDDPPEPPGTSAVVDDIEVFEHPDQWPTADVSGVDEDERDEQ